MPVVIFNDDYQREMQAALDALAPAPKETGETVQSVAYPELISRLVEINAKRSALASEDKTLSAEKEALVTQLLEAFDRDGIKGTRIDGYSASCSSDDIYTPNDWTAFQRFVATSDSFYLLQKRVSNAAIKELIASGVTIPGIGEPFVKRTINLRKSA